MAREGKDMVVGLDIGTAKVMAVVAEVLPDGNLRIAGLGSRRRTGSSAASSSTSTPRCSRSSRR
jgi:cell division ATPase FtsA